MNKFKHHCSLFHNYLINESKNFINLSLVKSEKNARYKYGDFWSPTFFLQYYFSKYIHLGFLLIFNISINVFFFHINIIKSPEEREKSTRLRKIDKYYYSISSKKEWGYLPVYMCVYK